VSSRLRSVPAIDRLLREAGELEARFSRGQVVEALRAVCQDLRARLAAGSEEAVEERRLVDEARERLEAAQRPRLDRVINATGVVLHTNLGRAPLAAAALERLHVLATGYSNLELDLESGTRGSRYHHVAALLERLTGAEAALVVNNCAAAMMLIVDTFARGREVVVSRGELVEIGGSFRVPDVLERGGARLVEVGSTNKTHLRDYARALSPDTGMLLSTHTSNFRIVGFTATPEPAELVALAREHGITSCLDLGSGLLFDLGFDEPTIPAMVAAGFDLVAFSGDKLLGGPQAGIIVGSRTHVEKLGRNPMTRALRVDKLTFAALEATLRLYLDPERARREIPVLRMLTRPAAELEKAARRLARNLRRPLEGRAEVTVVPGSSSVGGGSLPGRELPTSLVRLIPHEESEEEWATRLRRGRPAVMIRRQEGALLVDPRTLEPEDERTLVKAFEGL